jgi:large subunit ribosomal protein L15
MNELSNLQPAPGSVKKGKRVGRGIGSGLGKTCGRGNKGQKARSGGSTKPGFEGGQMPLQRRLPKFGFSNYVSHLEYQAINVSALSIFDRGAVVDLAALKAAGLVKGHDVRVKVLGDGELDRAVVVKADRVAGAERPVRTKSERRGEWVVVSASAASKITAAGGAVDVG